MTSSATAPLTAYTGRYTQGDPIGFPGGLNLYSYADSNPVLYKDPNGLVTVRQTFTRRGGLLGGGGQYSLGFGRASATGQCVCQGGDRWFIRLTLNFDHGYLCSGSESSCRIELCHGNIASAFVSRAAQAWNRYEQVAYPDRAACESAARFYAHDLEENITTGDRWPEELRRRYWNAQNDYEYTHHGWCAIPGLCPN